MNRSSRTLISRWGHTGCQFLALSFCLLLSTSCSTISFGRFHEEKAANVILHFFGWEAIYMTRPDTRQAGYLPLLSRAQVERELKHRVLPRDLAVVVIGNTYADIQVAQLADEWKKLLAAQGFHRVVLLRAGLGHQIDGLPIIEDSAISSAHDKQSRAATYAALPPAAGADAPHSSVSSIR
jgi:hypothetical protein